MKFLLIHQNFPGQFRQLAPFLYDQGHDIVAICSHQRPILGKFRVFRYEVPPKPPEGLAHSSQLANESLQRAEKVARVCEQLKQEGWTPDLICAHSGWGETLGIKEVWPDIPQIIWPELWLRPEHSGWGVDLEKPRPSLTQQLEHLGRNTLTRAALSQASAWVVPTHHQARSFPQQFQDHRMKVIHEGIDTSIAIPNPSVSLEVRGITITKETPTITFVNRNLERLRGFDTFMRALPEIQRKNKEVRVLIVGDNEGGYGGGHPSGRMLKEIVLEELAGQLDLTRIHFLGRISYPLLISLFQISAVHVYLSYPFVLGWSLLEAMACGCCIVGSKGMPVSEVIQDQVEGLLVSIDDPLELSNSVIDLLNKPDYRSRLSINARQKSLEWDQKYTLEVLSQFLNRQILS